MIALLNIILPLIVAAILFAAYKVKKTKAKIKTLFMIPLVVVVYGLFQPSYMPKGEVKKSVITYSYSEDKEARQSLLRKPIDSEIWDDKMKAERKEIERRLGETK